MERKKLVLATTNAGKVREISAMLPQDLFEVVTMRDAGFTADIAETGSTFAENALCKACAVAGAFPDAMVLADDSGLVIDALGGEPGIYSSRYLGEKVPYPVKCASLLRRLQDVPEERRTARFICAMVLILPDGRQFETTGTLEGRIAREVRGTGGFGYDPIFFVPSDRCTAAELAPERKNEISHRGRALRAMVDILKRETRQNG